MWSVLEPKWHTGTTETQTSRYEVVQQRHIRIDTSGGQTSTRTNKSKAAILDGLSHIALAHGMPRLGPKALAHGYQGLARKH